MHGEPISERTRAGLQYVIPGAERRESQRSQHYPREGAQLVIPGAERISVRELLQRRMMQGIASRRGQRSVDATPLFGPRTE